MRRTRTELSEADRVLWAAYAGQLRPLPGRARPAPPASPPILSPPASPPTVTPPPLRALPRDRGVTVGSAPPGLDRGTWQRFAGGKLAVERRLDLHGHTAQHAYRRFEQVILHASAQGLRCIEVITGRGAGEGGGILKRELPLWLNLPHLRPLVLAASHPHAGNQGSVRLLLRRNPLATGAALPSPQSRR